MSEALMFHGRMFIRGEYANIQRINKTKLLTTGEKYVCSVSMNSCINSKMAT